MIKLWKKKLRKLYLKNLFIQKRLIFKILIFKSILKNLFHENASTSSKNVQVCIVRSINRRLGGGQFDSGSHRKRPKTDLHNTTYHNTELYNSIIIRVANASRNFRGRTPGMVSIRFRVTNRDFYDLICSQRTNPTVYGKSRICVEYCIIYK